MEIINVKNESFHVLKLILFKSFVMFCCSILCGWIIYNFFPNWIEADFLLTIKTSVIGTLLLGWIITYPKRICSKIWGLCLISLLGGIFFSLLFIFYGVKYCLLGCGGIFIEFIFAILLGKLFQDKISETFLLRVVFVIFAFSFIHYIYIVIKYNVFNNCLSFYTAFILLAFAQLTFACSNATKTMNCIVNSKEKHPQNRYAILFYLNLMGLGFFMDVSRIIVLTYYHVIQILCFQKK